MLTESQRAAQKRYRETHIDRVKEKDRRYRLKNRETILAKKRAKRNSPQGVAKCKEYESRPEVREARRAMYRRISKTPERRAYEKRWRDAHKEICNAATVNWRHSPRGTTKTLLASATRRSRDLGLDFNLDFDDIYPAVLAGVCQRTGIRFSADSARVANSPKPYAPSIDRIDPRIGYIKGNIQVVLWMYNRCKGVGTDADVLAMARALVAKNPAIAAAS